MRFKKIWFILLLCCFAAGANGQQEVQEATLKGAFIYNFTKYIDWNLYDNESAFIIGVIGSSPIITALNEIAETNTVNGKKIDIMVFDNPDEIRFCHILFIPEKVPFPLSSILAKMDKGMLTISEEPGFARHGTAFNFVRENGKLKFEANLKALSNADIKAGSQLLKLAIIVN